MVNKNKRHLEIVPPLKPEQADQLNDYSVDDVYKKVLQMSDWSRTNNSAPIKKEGFSYPHPSKVEMLLEITAYPVEGIVDRSIMASVFYAKKGDPATNGVIYIRSIRDAQVPSLNDLRLQEVDPASPDPENPQYFDSKISTDTLMGWLNNFRERPI